MKPELPVTSSHLSRFPQANREAILSIVLAFLYMAWWYVTAYTLGSVPVEKYSYIMGFPAWFFLSCIAGFFIFSILSFLMVRIFFVDMPLTDEPEKKGQRGHNHA